MPRIEDKIGVSYRQLHHWTQLGYIRAEGGNGKQYRYSISEIRTARIIGHLVKIGFQPRFASTYARALTDDQKGGAVVLQDGKLKLSGVFAGTLREALVPLEAEQQAQEEKHAARKTKRRTDRRNRANDSRDHESAA